MGFSMIFTRILGDLKVETEDCSPGGLESCRDRWTVDMHPLAADELGACKRSLQQGNSSWGLGRTHVKAAKGRRKLLGGF